VKEERIVFVLLLGAGLLTHQFMYIIMYRRYLTINFAPALGVRLPDRLFTVVQILGIPAVVALLAVGGLVPRIVALAVYILWASVQSMRISNHVWLAFLGLAIVELSGPLEQVTEARLLLGTLYLVTGSVKFNGPFLFSDQSAARVIINLQATNGKWRAPKFVLALSPFVVAIGEFGTGAMLLANFHIFIAFLICAILHFTFGFVGNVHFSLIALSFWSVALGCRFPDLDVIGRNWVFFLIAFVFGAGSSYLLKANLRDFIDPRSLVGIYASAFLNGLYCAAVVLVWLAMPGRVAPIGTWGVGAVITVIVVAVNFLLLVTGFKSEWSYVMFSNVRPYGKARIFGCLPRWRARYYAVEWEGDPSAAGLSSVPENIRPQLKARSHLYSGPVVREFMHIAKRTGERIVVVPVRFDEEGTPVKSLDDVTAPSGGPLWFAPSISRDPTAVHLG
jgi:hypothetical protein